jgi:hypothetical protein
VPVNGFLTKFDLMTGAGCDRATCRARSLLYRHASEQRRARVRRCCEGTFGTAPSDSIWGAVMQGEKFPHEQYSQPGKAPRAHKTNGIFAGPI